MCAMGMGASAWRSAWPIHWPRAPDVLFIDVEGFECQVLGCALGGAEPSVWQRSLWRAVTGHRF